MLACNSHQRKLNFITIYIFHFLVYCYMFAILVFPVHSTILQLMEEQESCAAIQLFNNNSDDDTEVNLYENSIIPLVDLEKVRKDKLENALFFVGGNDRGAQNCLLEICGFSRNGDIPYLWGTCEWYNETENGEPIVAPPDIYARKFGYEVTSLTCACNDNYSVNCKTDNCTSRNDSYTWQGSECAILFQEKHCQSCYFTPIKLETQTQVCRFNTYHIKSMIIRPGCRVERTSRGDLWWPEEDMIKNYTGVVDSNGLEAVYHADSSNFTCVCTPEIGPSPPSPCAPRPTTPIENSTATLEPTTFESTTPESATSESTTLESTTFESTTFESTTFESTTLESTTFESTTPDFTTLESTAFESTTLGPPVITDDDKGGIPLILIIIFSCGGFIVLIVISTLSLKRFWFQRKPKVLFTLDFQDEPSLRNSAALEIFHKDKNKKQSVNQKQTAKSSIPPSPYVGSEAIVHNIGESERDDKNELKIEIMEEVRKLVGSILGSIIEHDETLFTNIKTSNDEEHKNHDAFTVLKQQFLQVCNPDHIICIDTITIPKISKENPVGEGQFGTVHKGYLRSDSDGLMELVAIKRIKWIGSQKESVAQSFLREIKTFESIGAGNEYIVKFLGACCHPDGLFIVTRLCEGGSLKRHLMKIMRPKILPNALLLGKVGTCTSDGYFDSAAEQKLLERMQPLLNSADFHQLILWCEQITCGMEYLSTKGIIHVDLAARNVLLSKEGTAKICDFGLSRKCLNAENYTMSLVSGSFPFNSFAPEYSRENRNEPRKVSLFVDIWAFGCTMWEMFTLGDSLYADIADEDMFKIISIRELLLEGYRHPKPPLAPDFIYEKMLECWNEVPKDRPSFTNLRNFFETTRENIILHINS